MTSRRSSGSRRAESGVEPTRSENITVTWRRSAVSLAASSVSREASDSGVGALTSVRKVAMASSNLRRCPTDPIPSSLRSSAVKLGRTVLSTLFSRNAASYCSRPSVRSQPPTSMVASTVRLKFYDPSGEAACLVPGHPVYGLGGCAVLAHDLDPIIRDPWREVTKERLWDRRTRRCMPMLSTRENILAVAEFFETQLPFFRLGAIILFKTAAADGLGLVSTLAKVLQERIRGIASRTAF